MDVYDLRLLPDDGVVVEEDLAPAWLDQHLNDSRPPGEPDLRAPAPGHARLELLPIQRRPEAKAVRVRGEVRARLETACVRCLAEVQFDTQSTVDTTFFPREAQDHGREDDADARAAKRVANVELARSALDEATYDKDELDLPAIVRESLLLGVDMNPRCADEAACTERTQALLETAAAAQPAWVDPRWAALEKLRSKTN